MTVAVVIPAAGVGSRMQADRPKQYLTLAGKTVLEHTIAALRQLPQLQQIWLALSADDPYFPTLPLAADASIHRVTGGAERAHSVLAGLAAIDAQQYPWTLVHDAARPLVLACDIEKLLSHCLAAGHGGILAAPVRDTMKRGVAAGGIALAGHSLVGPSLVGQSQVVDHQLTGLSLVAQTVERQQLWHALTPQLFPTQLLRDSLSRALAAGATITDEASALEWAGQPVLLVPGRADNLKITQPEDLALASFYLEQR